MSINRIKTNAYNAALIFLTKVCVFGYKVIKHLTSLLSQQCFEQLGPELQLWMGLCDYYGVIFCIYPVNNDMAPHQNHSAIHMLWLLNRSTSAGSHEEQ